MSPGELVVQAEYKQWLSGGVTHHASAPTAEHRGEPGAEHRGEGTPRRPPFTSQGFPPGDHAAGYPAPWWTPHRIILAASALFLVFGWMQKANCLRTSASTEGLFINWAGRPQYTSACYSDIIVLFHGRGFDKLSFPYAFSWVEEGTTRYLEYPVGTGLFQYAMAAITRPVAWLWETLGFPDTALAGINFGVSAFFLALLWMVSCALVVNLTGRRTWDGLLMALSPVVIVHAFTNYDSLSIFFALAGITLWARQRPAWAGVFLGLGVAAKLWPIFVLGAVILLCLRLRAWLVLARVVGAAALAWVAVNLPIYVLYSDAWAEFFRLNSARGWEGSTIYAVVAHLTGRDSWEGISPGKAVAGVHSLNMLSLVVLLALLVALAWVVLSVKHTPRLGQVVFLCVLAFMVSNKVWSPQYSLWLVPLIVLALPRWRLVFTWAAVEAVYWYLRMWQFLPAGQAAPNWLVDTATLLRLGLLVAMAVLVLCQIYGTAADPVRNSHNGEDPLAGLLAEPSGGLGDRRHSASLGAARGDALRDAEVQSPGSTATTPPTGRAT